MPKSTVIWADGTSDGRKIVYIPQTYLNRTIDDPEEDTAINKIIEDVLLQTEDLNSVHSRLEDDIDRLKKQVASDVAEYCAVSKKLHSIQAQIKESGASTVFSKAIESLEKERGALASKIDVRQEEIDRYGELEALIASKRSRQIELNTELGRLQEMPAPQVVFPGYFTCIDGYSIENRFDHDFPTVGGRLNENMRTLNESILPTWQIQKDALIELISKSLSEIASSLESMTNEREKLRVKVERSEQLQRLSIQIAQERQKLEEAKGLEDEKRCCNEQMSQLQQRIIGSQKLFYNTYEEYYGTISKTGTRQDTDLDFKAHAVWRQKDFLVAIGEIFDRRNYSSFKSKFNFDLAELKPNEYDESFCKALWDAMTMEPLEVGYIGIKASHSLETAMTTIFGDWYNIHYVVKSGDDEIEKMSPGKKALVLLELLISLENSRCPILIDQPEDDLDNRSIYDDLVSFIRTKKKERQIIIVTHNANVVLGADAEEVIIANQDGKNTENAQKKFEYRSGSIENDFPIRDQDGHILPGILNSKGLQTQICDILEGGRTAFELRRSKYSTISRH